ncbi:MAG: hypothetical protein KDD37_02250 [Bdellovibrionales bacterium]|nr:hypothetical protein [Bdellovibrionales bacterium]
METVLQISEKLKKLENTKNPVVLAFSNYLKHYKGPADTFDLHTLEGFCRRAYSFEYWRSEMPNFQNHLKRILGYVFSEAECRELSKSYFLQNLQIISIENKRDFLPIIEKYAETKNVSYRYFSVGANDILVVYTWKNGNKALQILNTNCFINEASISPLTTDEIIYYDASMEILPFTLNQVNIGSFQNIVFEKNYHNTKIKSLRGYTLQCVEEKTITNLQEHSKLFYSLKRLESLLVGKDHHPLYEELTRLLEDALKLLHSKDPRAQRLAYTALERGKNAVENIFPNDKLLQLLLKEVAANLQKALEGSDLHGSTSQ